MKSEKQLYQWDVNQYLTGINPAAQYVDYPIGNEVIRLETAGARCRIPDEILQTCGGKTCYERYPDGTYRAYSFTVLYAPKPPDYVYTPEERTTFETLTARVDAELVEVKPGECNGRGYYFRFVVPAEIDTVDKFIKKYGDDYIYFELATITTEPVTIPEALQEWLPVEPGGTVTFRNADESKQLAVPNAVSWVRKLNEVE